MSTKTTKKETTQKPASHDDRFIHAAKLLDEVANVLALASPGALTAKQRRQVARARKGADKAIPTIAELAAQYGIDLPLQRTAAMSSNLALAQQLEPLRRQLVVLLGKVEEVAFHAKGTSWATATTLYGILRRAAHRDSELAAQLETVAEYFAIRRASKKSKTGDGAAPAPTGKTAKGAAATKNAAPAAAPSEPSASGSPTDAAHGAAASGVAHA